MNMETEWCTMPRPTELVDGRVSRPYHVVPLGLKRSVEGEGSTEGLQGFKRLKTLTRLDGKLWPSSIQIKLSLNLTLNRHSSVSPCFFYF